MDFRADLHIHSYYSDGNLSPEEILLLAKKISLSGLSITDHDTIEAYNDELFDLAKKLELKLITGVEISSELDGENVHILGYNFDRNNVEFRQFLNEVQKKRTLRNSEIIKKLNQKKIEISEEELYAFAQKKNIAQTIIGRVHIAYLMFEKGYVNSIQKAFDDYIQDEGPCFVKGFKFSPDQIITQIHQAKGKAVLAHPNLLKSKKVIDKILKFSFDGIEVYYGKLFVGYEKRWLDVAKKNNLLITGGSDFHGDIRPYVTLGCSWVDEETFKKLLS
jgi:3',5'-nucleoside bisphosphate phosphatase